MVIEVLYLFALLFFGGGGFILIWFSLMHWLQITVHNFCYICMYHFLSFFSCIMHQIKQENLLNHTYTLPSLSWKLFLFVHRDLKFKMSPKEDGGNRCNFTPVVYFWFVFLVLKLLLQFINLLERVTGSTSDSAHTVHVLRRHHLIT